MEDRTETYQNNTSLVEYLRKFEMRWKNKARNVLHCYSIPHHCKLVRLLLPLLEVVSIDKRTSLQYYHSNSYIVKEPKEHLDANTQTREPLLKEKDQYS